MVQEARCSTGQTLFEDSPDQVCMGHGSRRRLGVLITRKGIINSVSKESINTTRRSSVLFACNYSFCDAAKRSTGQPRLVHSLRKYATINKSVCHPCHQVFRCDEFVCILASKHFYQIGVNSLALKMDHNNAF